MSAFRSVAAKVLHDRVGVGLGPEGFADRSLPVRPARAALPARVSCCLLP